MTIATWSQSLAVGSWSSLLRVIDNHNCSHIIYDKCHVKYHELIVKITTDIELFL